LRRRDFQLILQQLMPEGTMRDALTAMADDEQGRRFLLNLHWALEDGSCAGILDRLATAVGPIEDASRRAQITLERIKAAIFARPEEFQFRGRAPSPAPARWITIRSAEELLKLARSGLGAAYGGPFSDIVPEGQDENQSDRHYRDIAKRFNYAEPSLSFPLSQVYGDRLAPVWLSRWGAFSQDCPEAQDLRRAATRLRDWLGLAHYAAQRPIFLIRTRAEVHPEDLDAHRPTILDAMPPRLFKHPTAPGRDWAGCGSTADIALLRQAGSATVDGGPEVVARHVRFSSATHECLFLGRVGELDYDWEEECFHRHLLPRAGGLEAVLAQLAGRLGGVGGA
jgi:hypothetical protein